MKYILLFAVTALLYCAGDLLWVGVFAKTFYRERLGFILSEKTNWAAVLIFYIIYISGILYFAVIPSLNTGSWQTALLNGCFLGLLCYGTYDLVNMATIAKWPLIITIIDIAWGVVVTGAVSISAYLLGSKFIF